MNGSGETPHESIKQEPGLPLKNIKHCKIGNICWFTRSEIGETPYRDLGIIIDIDAKLGWIVLGSLTDSSGNTEWYDKQGKWHPRVPHRFGCPVKTNLSEAKKHLDKLKESGKTLDMQFAPDIVRKVVARANKIDKPTK